MHALIGGLKAPWRPLKCRKIGVEGSGGAGVGPCPLRAPYLREFVQLPSSWPPARGGGGAGAAVHDSLPVKVVESSGSASVPKSSVSSTRNAHFLKSC